MKKAQADNAIDMFGDVDAECAMLARRDSVLARALDAIGAPHIRRRKGGFQGLFRIIVEQQVSVPSAQAVWRRCQSGIAPMTPASVCGLGEDALRGFGLSTPKASYVSALADAVRAGELNFSEISRMSDGDALAALQNVRGVGPWTASIYLLFCCGRADIWPPGDIALLNAYKAARLRRPNGLTMNGLDSRAGRWAPRRGLAAHILWTYYAHIRGRTPI